MRHLTNYTISNSLTSWATPPQQVDEMNDQVETNTEAVNVGIEVYRNIKKDVKEYTSILKIDDKCLPVMFLGVSTEEVRKKAENFYNDELFNKVHEYNFIDPIADDMEAQKLMIEAFELYAEPAAVEATTSVKRRASASAGDKRLNGGWMFVFHEEKQQRKRCSPDELPALEAEGWKAGRGTLTTDKKRVSNRQTNPDYVSPIKGKVWMNNGSERIRIDEVDVGPKLVEGWLLGRGTFVDVTPDDTVVIPPVERPAPDFE